MSNCRMSVINEIDHRIIWRLFSFLFCYYLSYVARSIGPYSNMMRQRNTWMNRQFFQIMNDRTPCSYNYHGLRYWRGRSGIEYGSDLCPTSALKEVEVHGVIKTWVEFTSDIKGLCIRQRKCDALALSTLNPQPKSQSNDSTFISKPHATHDPGLTDWLNDWPTIHDYMPLHVYRPNEALKGRAVDEQWAH
jgi:hypothetical protein